MAARDVAVPSSRRSKPDETSGARARGSALEERYRSLFVIGRGGMGTVEAALELGGAKDEPPAKSDFERVVALKRLLPDSARDQRRAEMFLREAKLAAMLHHPNVVRAFDYGELDGELYLAMEYVEGQPLSRLLRALADAKADPLAPGLAAHLLAEVCEGLHAAHELAGEDGQPLQLVHRDVSPQNVMLGYDGHVRLLDFGVAKIEAESVTKTGEVKGKTAYMSPEQAMGDAIDRRSDLFGVGAVLYECLTNQRMWGDGTDMEVIRKLALEQPPELPGAPEPMRALYKRLVAREAKDRPATALAVAEALRAMCPEGRDEASRALQELLAKRFGDQAIEQRKRLSNALEDVAPDQADALRESVMPGVVAPSVSRGVEAAEARANDRPSEGRSRAPLWGGLALVSVLAIVGWKMAQAPAPPPAIPPTNVPTVTTATVAATMTAEPTASATVATATTTASVKPPLPTIATPSIAPGTKSPPSATRVIAQPKPEPTKPVTTTTAAPTTSKPPLNVDPNPL